MSALTAYNQDGLELVIDNQTGECFASVSATARMCEVHKSTISRSVATLPLKSAEIVTPAGLRSVALLNEEQILECAIQHNPQLAAKFARVGLRVYLHQLAGYKVTSTATEQPKLTQTEILAAALQEMVKFEKDLNATKAQLKATQETLSGVEQKVDKINTLSTEATEYLNYLPDPEPVEVPKITNRVHLNELVRAFSLSNYIEPRQVWNDLYKEYRNRFRVDLKLRARNANYRCVLDYVVDKGYLDSLYALAYYLYVEMNK